jgi:hypothetical protein
MARTNLSDVTIKGDLTIGDVTLANDPVVNLTSNSGGGSLLYKASFSTAATAEFGMVYTTSPSVSGYGVFRTINSFSIKNIILTDPGGSALTETELT